MQSGNGILTGAAQQHRPHNLEGHKNEKTDFRDSCFMSTTLYIKKQSTHQSLADLEQHIRVVESSAMILPSKLDVCARFRILPRDMVVLSVISHWSDGWRQWVDVWVFTIPAYLFHSLTCSWQSLSIDCVTMVT